MQTRSLKFRAVRQIRLAFPRLARLSGRWATLIQSLPPGRGGLTLPKGALFIAPDGAGSLGDSAMMHAGIAHLRAQGVEQFGVVYPQYGVETPDWSHIPHVTESIGVRYKPEDYLARSRQSLGNYWQDLRRFRQIAQAYGQVYCIGADVMDGYYSLEICDFLTDLMAIAASTGAQTTLVGFSFNQNPKPRAVQALKALPPAVRLCSRDPLSQARAQRQLDRSVELVADAAFLLEPTQTTAQVQTLLEWIAHQRQANRILVGINTNAMLLRAVEGLTVERFIGHYAHTLTRLVEDESELSFVTLPHDDRDEIHDVFLTQRLLEALPESIRDRCATLQLPCAPGDVKTVCGQLDLVVTSRMHVAIASLGQSTPTLSITYQDKHEGLYQHFAIPQLLISPAAAFEPEGLVNFIQTYLPQRAALRRHLEARLPMVMELARSNFSAQPAPQEPS
ncbi:MAG: hypothetical protein HC857_00300 [Synechococcales cyanobacterium RU_4_20]|nr:hypothetical protein [Synechococcales cyanobacterium RU_4_20]NJR68322.1 hypothetical protein [Synechococcales cyanobacterium CRU_2_2]